MNTSTDMKKCENVPTNKKLWKSVIALSKRKYKKVSAYSNGFAVQEYKRRGGKWKKVCK